jgi:very-short-patch-repair endonuclease
MPFGKYFLDFAFVEIKLDLEIDGQQHLSPKILEHDQIRDLFSNSQGCIEFK